MSIKAKTFQTLIGRPLNTHNFFIQIPTMSDIELMVSATSFPTEKMRAKVLHYQGEKVHYPVIPERGGVWTCTIPEGEYAKVYKSASLDFKVNFLQDLGIGNFWALTDKFDVVVGIKTIDSGVHHRSSETPFSVKMKDCFFLGMDQVNLGANQATQAWAWQLSFQYDSLDYSHTNYLRWLANKVTLGLVDDVYRAGGDGRHALPKLPNIQELSIGKNELAKQGLL